MEGGPAKGGPKKLIYVGGLAEEVDTKVLNAAFVPFGDIVEVDIRQLLKLKKLTKYA